MIKTSWQAGEIFHNYIMSLISYVLNVFIDIQTSKELIQIDTDKMTTYGTFTMDDEKLTVIIKHNIIGSLYKYSINQNLLDSFINLILVFQL